MFEYNSPTHSRFRLTLYLSEIIGHGGTLLITDEPQAHFMLPSNVPETLASCIRDVAPLIARLSARDIAIYELLAHTISPLEAATVLGISEAAVIGLLEARQIGGARVNTMWHVSKEHLVAQIAPEAAFSDRGPQA